MSPPAPLLRGNLVTPHGLLEGHLQWADGQLTHVEGRAIGEQQAADNGLPWLLPGFIDLHVHGGGGRDSMEGGDAMRAVARSHARHGTTALLATTMTAERPQLEHALRGAAPWIAQRPSQAACILGVHLEGPYLNRGKLGAQPDHVRPAQWEEVLALNELAPIRLVTLAPELPGHRDLIERLSGVGIVVQLGHSEATYEEGVAALQAGAGGFTHLFNAMTGLHHRAPGLAGAALAHAERAEIIPDLLHVHPGAIRVALRCIPQLYCVTDSTSAAGMPDGPYRLGSQTVHKCLGGVRLADGTLAGSTLTMDQALRNLVGLGLGMVEASLRTSTHAARHLRLSDRGALRPGFRADVVALDRQLRLTGVWVEGEPVEPAEPGTPG